METNIGAVQYTSDAPIPPELQTTRPMRRLSMHMLNHHTFSPVLHKTPGGFVEPRPQPLVLTPDDEMPDMQEYPAVHTARRPYYTVAQQPDMSWHTALVLPARTNRTARSYSTKTLSMPVSLPFVRTERVSAVHMPPLHRNALSAIIGRMVRKTT